LGSVIAVDIAVSPMSLKDRKSDLTDPMKCFATDFQCHAKLDTNPLTNLLD